MIVFSRSKIRDQGGANRLFGLGTGEAEKGTDGFLHERQGEIRLCLMSQRSRLGGKGKGNKGY